MSGNNGRERGGLLQGDRLAEFHRPQTVPEAKEKELLDGLADRLGDRVRGAIQEQMQREVYPVLHKLEDKVEGLSHRLNEGPRPSTPPEVVQVSRQAAQRAARNRVD